jgi:hypothetical protein
VDLVALALAASPVIARAKVRGPKQWDIAANFKAMGYRGRLTADNAAHKREWNEEFFFE